MPEDVPARVLSIPGLQISFSPLQLIPLFIAIISLTGAYWVLISNPEIERKGWLVQQVLPNLVLPAINIFIFALILIQTNKSYEWWGGILFAGVLTFSIILYAEYQVMKSNVSTNTIFTVLLISLAHALFMAFTIALRASISRVFFDYSCYSACINFRFLSYDLLTHWWKVQSLLDICGNFYLFPVCYCTLLLIPNA